MIKPIPEKEKEEKYILANIFSFNFEFLKTKKNQYSSNAVNVQGDILNSQDFFADHSFMSFLIVLRFLQNANFILKTGYLSQFEKFILNPNHL